MASWGCLFEGANGLNTLTSRNPLSYVPPQKPFATTSSRAPSWVLAVALVSCSLESGCKVGSTATPGQISVSRLAVKSLISLCRKRGILPLGMTGHGGQKKAGHKRN